MPSRDVEDENSVHHFAEVLCRKRLRLPALIILEAGRPLAFLIGQLLWVAQPFVDLLLPQVEIGKVAQLMEDSTSVEQLILVLEVENPE